MFSFFKKKPAASPAPPAATDAAAAAPAPSLIGSALVQPLEIPAAAPVAPERQSWVDKLSAGLRKTGTGLTLSLIHI